MFITGHVAKTLFQEENELLNLKLMANPLKYDWPKGCVTLVLEYHFPNCGMGDN